MRQPLAELDEAPGRGGALEHGEPQRAFRGDRGDHSHAEAGPGRLDHRGLPDRRPGGPAW